MVAEKEAPAPRRARRAKREQEAAVKVGRWFKRYAKAAPVASWAQLAANLQPKGMKAVDPKIARRLREEIVQRLQDEIAAFDGSAAGRPT